jgi:transposase
MTEITRAPVARVGVDLSKRVYQVHAVDRSGHVLVAKPMAPDRFFNWCAELPAGCLVAMEACGGAHHVARRLRLLGLDARLIAGHFVSPYRMGGKSGKNDANDAAAICEAASRPHMRFVPTKTAEQQGQLTLHRLREVVQDRANCTDQPHSRSAGRVRFGVPANHRGVAPSAGRRD